MGNRSWLYLESGAPGRREHLEIADANNHFPELWQVMLADGAAGRAVVDQRVFGDSGTPNLVSDAATALARCRLMADFVARHPLAAAHPVVALQFEALVAWFDECLADARAEGGDPVRLSANLDELAWLDGGAPDDFIERRRQDCSRRWDAVRASLRDDSPARFDAALGITRFGDLQAWSWNFGFGGLAHPYFNHGQSLRAVPWSTFVDATAASMAADEDDEYDEDEYDEDQDDDDVRGDDHEGDDGDPQHVDDDDARPATAGCDAAHPVFPFHASTSRIYEVPDALRTMRRVAGGRVFGVFDERAGREVVPCRHAWLALFGWGDEHGWLVADPAGDDSMRMGVLRAEGGVLFAQDYAWIASPMLGENDFGPMPPHGLHRAWHAAQPVQAVRIRDDAYVWLHRDGREASHAEHARERRAAGDRAAAEQFAGHLRDGEGVAQDLAAARDWFGFAAGLAEGGDPTDPSRAAPAGLASAMGGLAVMLRSGQGGPADHVAARAWLLRAFERGGREDVEVNFQLARMLDLGQGGAADPERARRHYGIAAGRGYRPAIFNLGLMHMQGTGGPVDVDEAIRLFRDADALGDIDASYHLGGLLAQRAAEAGEAPASPAWLEAAYFLRKCAENDAARDQLLACYSLGRAHVDGSLGPDGPRHALPWLLRGAELAGGADPDPVWLRHCAGLLADKVYGPADSPVHDPAEASRWVRIWRPDAPPPPAGPPDLSAMAGAGLGAVSRWWKRLFGGRD